MQTRVRAWKKLEKSERPKIHTLMKHAVFMKPVFKTDKLGPLRKIYLMLFILLKLVFLAPFKAVCSSMKLQRCVLFSGF